jgi:hypothetical protein
MGFWEGWEENANLVTQQKPGFSQKPGFLNLPLCQENRFFQKTQISLLARNQVFSKNLVSYISVS